METTLNINAYNFHKPGSKKYDLNPILPFPCLLFFFFFLFCFTLPRLLLTPMNKNLCAKTTKYIPKCWERSVKRKSNLSFITVIKNSSFDQQFPYVMVKTFLKILGWWFLVPPSEHLLVNSTTLLCKTQKILTL